MFKRTSDKLRIVLRLFSIVSVVENQEISDYWDNGARAWAAGRAAVVSHAGCTLNNIGSIQRQREWHRLVVQQKSIHYILYSIVSKLKDYADSDKINWDRKPRKRN